MSNITDKYKLNDVMYSREQIEARAAEIGRQITADYAGEEVIFVGILRGAVMWLSEVIKSVELEALLDFMVVSSYGAATKTSGVVRIDKDLTEDIDGKHVIIVEDVVDTGITLNYIKDYITSRGPASVKVCALLDKPSRRQKPVDIDYLGFTVENIFIVGYGLDVAQRYRNLPYITSVTVVEP
ncbi:MAG: hypoxanthine phosphoribosyltransferase [Clostridiales Family XIII bacterium]|jgi:hypoxanthine phosphoribosyltransferase|nr:hypoxanthine phosphoribosyltransferase [Clostridiales Family XIII bacterium]